VRRTLSRPTAGLLAPCGDWDLEGECTRRRDEFQVVRHSRVVDEGVCDHGVCLLLTKYAAEDVPGGRAIQSATVADTGASGGVIKKASIATLATSLECGDGDCCVGEVGCM
jgi:hypothetical protein